MKKRVILGAIVAAATLQASAAFADMRMTISSAQLRNGPGHLNPAVAVLPAGVYVDVVGCTDWCKVNYRGIQGWAMAGTLSPVFPSAPTVIMGQPSPYGWYTVPGLGLTVSVFQDRGRYYYEDRGRRRFIDKRHIKRTRPFDDHRRDRQDRHDRDHRR